MRLFGREPAFWVGLIEAGLALLLSLNLFGLTHELVSLVMAAVVAGLGVFTAWVTRDTLLGVGVGFAKAVLALAAGYGFSLSTDQTAAVIALLTIALGSFQRTQTQPLATPTFKEAPVRAA